jgi:hypothetical protein
LDNRAVAEPEGSAADGFLFLAEAALGLDLFDVGGSEGNFAVGVADVQGNKANLFARGFGLFGERFDVGADANHKIVHGVADAVRGRASALSASRTEADGSENDSSKIVVPCIVVIGAG